MIGAGLARPVSPAQTLRARFRGMLVPMPKSSWPKAAPTRAQLDTVLGFLADTPAGGKTLARIIERVTDIVLTRDELTLHVAGTSNTLLIAKPDGTRPKLPPDLARILAACGGIAFGEPGEHDAIELHDGTSGGLHALGKDAGLDAKRDGFAYAKTLCSPIDVGFGVFYIYHPRDGGLCRFDQDGGVERIATGVGDAFLDEVDRAL
jgi:hypothetical protein